MDGNIWLKIYYTWRLVVDYYISFLWMIWLMIMFESNYMYVDFVSCSTEAVDLLPINIKKGGNPTNIEIWPVRTSKKWDLTVQSWLGTRWRITPLGPQWCPSGSSPSFKMPWVGPSERIYLPGLSRSAAERASTDTIAVNIQYRNATWSLPMHA